MAKIILFTCLNEFCDVTEGFGRRVTSPQLDVGSSLSGRAQTEHEHILVSTFNVKKTHFFHRAANTGLHSLFNLQICFI